MTRTVIRNGWVVSMDPDIGTIAGADVLIEDGAIVAVDNDIDGAEAEIIDASGMIVMPGLINAHLHTWQTGIRGIAGDWSLEQYFKYMHRGMAASFTPEDIRLGTLVGALNQLDSGVTTLFDWLHNNPTPDHTDGGLDGLMESGIRALFGHGSPKHAPKQGEPHFGEIPHPRAEVERLRKGRLAADDGLVRLAMCILGPHFSTYDITSADLRLAAEYDVVASMHMDAGFERRAPDGIHRMRDDRLIDRRLNVVHGSDLSDEEISILVDGGASFSITAEAEMQYGFGHPITGRVIAAGGIPSIGSDTEAGVGGDMFTAMRMTLQMQRAVDHGPRVSSDNPVEGLSQTTRDALEWATIGGARALGMADEIGSLTPGKRADVILVRTGDMNLFPVNDPVQSIVLHACGANVDTVLVGGRVVKREGKLAFADLATRKKQLAESGARLIASAQSA